MSRFCAALRNGASSTAGLTAAIEREARRLVSAATVVELSIVMLGRFGEAGDLHIDRLLAGIDATIVPVSVGQANIARDAALRFGRTRHPAALNFGDCFSYALSMETGEALLFVGNDFTRTDVSIFVW